MKLSLRSIGVAVALLCIFLASTAVGIRQHIERETAHRQREEFLAEARERALKQQVRRFMISDKLLRELDDKARESDLRSNVQEQRNDGEELPKTCCGRVANCARSGALIAFAIYSAGYRPDNYKLFAEVFGESAFSYP